jgi:hypothetical protein
MNAAVKVKRYGGSPETGHDAAKFHTSGAEQTPHQHKRPAERCPNAHKDRAFRIVVWNSSQIIGVNDPPAKEDRNRETEATPAQNNQAGENRRRDKRQPNGAASKRDHDD